MSYVSQQFLLCDNSSSANFRIWAGAIDVALTTSGWVVTSDTGQTDPSSATVPSSGSFIYRVYKPADALQTGSTQYFVKIKYGTSSSSGPRIQVQIGTGTDGAGNLTGTTTTNFELQGNTGTIGQGSVVTFDSYFSGDTGRFGMLLWRSLNTQNMPVLMAIERTKNTDGTDSSDGVTIIVNNNSGSGGNRGHQTIVFGGPGVHGTTGGNAIFCALWNYSNNSDAFNNSIPVSPIFPNYGKYGNPQTVVGLVHQQDVAEGCQFSTTLYGATRTYVCTGSLNADNPNGSVRFCLRYD